MPHKHYIGNQSHLVEKNELERYLSLTARVGSDRSRQRSCFARHKGLKTQMLGKNQRSTFDATVQHSDIRNLRWWNVQNHEQLRRQL
jgi:hypothetical protein